MGNKKAIWTTDERQSRGLLSPNVIKERNDTHVVDASH